MGTFSERLREWLSRASTRKYGANALWMMAARASWILSAATVGIYVARRLGPHEFGRFHYALSLTGLFSIVTTLSVESITIRRLVSDPDSAPTTLGSFTALRAASFALTTVLLVSTLLVMGAPREVFTLCLVIGAGYFGFVLEGAALFYQANVDAKRVAIPQIVACLANIVLRSLAAYFHWPLVVFGAAEAGNSLIAFAGSLAIYSATVGSPLRWRPDAREVRELFMLALPLGLSGIFSIVDARIDNLMLNHFVGPDAVGQYAVAGRILENWNLIAAMLATAMLPAIVHAARESQRAYDSAVRRLYAGLFFGMLALAALTALVCRPVILVLFGEGYAPAVGILRAGVWSLLGNALILVFGQWAVTEQKTRMVGWVVGLGVCAKVALNLALVQRFGAVGVAWSTVIAPPAALLAVVVATGEGRGHLRRVAG